jgi:hypothetical protein
MFKNQLPLMIAKRDRIGFLSPFSLEQFFDVFLLVALDSSENFTIRIRLLKVLHSE